MGFVVAPGDFRVGNGHAMGNRRAADVRGHHTLNMSSASKAGHRIGDCMVLVKWRDGITTWEARSDWRAFRGKDIADWEICFFAKTHYDSGIPRCPPSRMRRALAVVPKRGRGKCLSP